VKSLPQRAKEFVFGIPGKARRGENTSSLCISKLRESPRGRDEEISPRDELTYHGGGVMRLGEDGPADPINDFEPIGRDKRGVIGSVIPRKRTPDLPLPATGKRTDTEKTVTPPQYIGGRRPPGKVFCRGAREARGNWPTN